MFESKKEYVTSIEDLSRELQKDKIFIKKQSLQDRFNGQASCFMKKMVEHALAKKISLSKAKINCSFSRIIINDSTFIQLPENYLHAYKGSGGGASKAAMKHQYCYDLLSQEILDITVQDATVPDSLYPLQDLQKNDLRLEDLGYFKVDKLREIEESEAYFINRMKFRVTIYQLKRGNYARLNLLKMISKMRVGEIKSIDVYIGEKTKFGTRLVIEKLPKNLSDEKRRKLKLYTKEKRRCITQERLMFCDVNAFITNCTEKQLPNQLIRQCYSLRWQIEIIFKAWKSYFKIADVKPIKMERFECIHYGSLMLIILCTNLLMYCKYCSLNAGRKEISELKFFKLILSMTQEIRAVISKSRKEISDVLDLLTTLVEITCIKEQRLKRLKPMQILQLLP